MRKITCGENDMEENTKEIILEPSSKAGLEDVFTVNGHSVLEDVFTVNGQSEFSINCTFWKVRGVELLILESAVLSTSGLVIAAELHCMESLSANRSHPSIGVIRQ